MEFLNNKPCCHKLEDPATGYWTKDRQLSCPLLRLNIVSLPGAQCVKLAIVIILIAGQEKVVLKIIIAYVKYK